MEKRIEHQPILCCVMIFAICAIARLLEYFLIRTDETVVSENFLHKVFGIIILAITLCSLHYKWKDIGFTRGGIVFGIGKGMMLGFCCFAVAYSIECFTLLYSNKNVSLLFYVSGFSLTGESVKQTGVTFFLLCIIFNLDGRRDFSRLIYEDTYPEVLFFIGNFTDSIPLWNLALGYAIKRLC